MYLQNEQLCDFLFSWTDLTCFFKLLAFEQNVPDLLPETQVLVHLPDAQVLAHLPEAQVLAHLPIKML